jgi:hypothetical protein
VRPARLPSAKVLGSSMWRNSCSRWKIGLVCLVVVLITPGATFAGWMGLKNDMNVTLVVQEIVVVNNQAKAGKPNKLAVGDVLRDTQFTPGGQRRFSIFDAANPNKPIYTGNFTCPKTNENVLYSIKPDGKGGVTVEVTKTAAGTK